MPNLSLRKLWRKRSATISERDPSYKVIYLGNMLTGWAKGDGCVDKPLSVLWRNYCQSNRSDIIMKITICSSGLRAVTKEHGLTEYWAHRVTYCGAHPAYPKVFCWVYRHEGRKLKQELRCHAVLCHRSDKAQVMAGQLKERLALALHEFRREKVTRQNARLSLVHAIYDNATLPTRKILLSTGTTNYRPPLERSKSAPKLGSIEETIEEEEEEEEDASIEEEDELEAVSEGATGRAVHCSPVNSIAPSETMSDIVHYANGGVELSTDCLLARSASQKGTTSGRETSETTGVDKTRRPARKFSDRASKSGSSGSSSSGGSSSGGGGDSGISSNNSNYNSSSSSSSSSNNNSNNSTIISTNSNDNCNNVPSTNLSSSHNNKRLLYVYSRPQPQSVKPPVIKRRFIRSISVDTSFDHDALDLNDFDYDSNDSDVEETTNTHQNHSQEGRIEGSSCTNVMASSRGGGAPFRRNLLGAKSQEGVGRALSDNTDDDLSSSLTSTDTTETVLDRPLMTEDTLSLLNSLSTSLARQLSLPSDPRPGANTAEESLTSDQPESLGSHCDSCSSSCGGCSSDNGTETGPQEDCLARDGSARVVRGRRCVMGLVESGMDGTSHHTRDLSSLSVDDAEEPDNISEESGYAEEKDFLQNTELAKALNA